MRKCRGIFWSGRGVPTRPKMRVDHDGSHKQYQLNFEFVNGYELQLTAFPNNEQPCSTNGGFPASQVQLMMMLYIHRMHSSYLAVTHFISE